MRKHRKVTWLAMAIVLLTVGLIGSCSDDSSPSKPNSPQARIAVSLPLENALTDVYIPANTPTQVVVTLHTPVDVGVITAASIDIASSVQHVSISTSSVFGLLRQVVTSLFSPQATAQVRVRVGTDPATVCEETLVYGPYTITTESVADPAPDSIELTLPTIEILNNGYAVLCIEVTSSVDVTFELDQIDAKIARHECSTPSNFAGVWSGTYQCGNSCLSPFGGDVTLTVTQNGATIEYTDGGGDHYTGTVCGNKFRFERIDTDEIERGTMTLIDATHAVKHSTWRSQTYPYCWGNCIDTLTR